MTRRGYHPRMIYGTIAAGGALGNLIPPGIATIIYGAIVEESVAKLFIACVIPGIMVTAIFHIYVWLAVHVRPALVPVGHADPPSLQERWTAVVDVFPVLALMTAVLGSLWFGIATPTESAGVGVTGAVLLALLYRGLTWAKLRDSLVNTVRVTCMLLFIILGAQILSFAFVRTGINRQVSEWVVSLDLSHWALLAVIAMLYITLGMLVDGISMMLLTLPVLYPVVINAGFDPIWFGVILVTLIEVGQITPPVGMVLFVIQGIARCSIGEVSRGALPFVLLFLVGLVLMALFPETATWLPSLMR
jgi:C4-dicarboxylate transporter, DctM subunit